VGAEAPRPRRWLRRTLSGGSIVLVLGGVGFIASPFISNVWQSRIQNGLRHQMRSPQLQQAYRQHHLSEGDSLTRIRIPAVNLDMVVVQGTGTSALRAGAGHYINTPLPCDIGNVGIAGHRTTFGKPFANLDRLKPGDTIELDTPIGGCVYTVAKDPFVVAPDDLAVLASTGSKSLTLTTCHPKGSAAQRLVIRATWAKDVTPT
jgi:sortase A